MSKVRGAYITPQHDDDARGTNTFGLSRRAVVPGTQAQLGVAPNTAQLLGGMVYYAVAAGFFFALALPGPIWRAKVDFPDFGFIFDVFLMDVGFFC